MAWKDGTSRVKTRKALVASAINSFVIIKPGPAPAPGGCMFAIYKHSINGKDRGSIKSVDK
jgi:hypothetical protein